MTHARVLLIGSYLVALVEVCRPFLDHPGQVGRPVWQSVGILFIALNVVALVALRPYALLMALVALNAILAGATLIGASVTLLSGRLPLLWDFDLLIVVVFFAGFVPIVATALLYAAARAPNNRWRGP